MSELQSNIKNFGTIKSVYNHLLSESLIDKSTDKKKLFKHYVDTINESKILRTLFEVYTNLENKVEPDFNKATLYVNESIALLNKYSKKDIYEANKKLAEKVSFEQDTTSDLAELHESITNLIFTEKTPKTIDVIVESTSKIVNHLVNNKPKEILESYDVPNSMLLGLLVEKYNSKYSELDTIEQSVIKSFVEGDDTKKDVYSSMIRECLNLIDEKLDTKDLDAKDKLLKVKDKLLNDKLEINEDYVKNISKLVELRSNLKEN